MSKSLGIIQINIPSVTLSFIFGTGNDIEITSALSDKEKNNIIQACKGEKLVYFNCPEIEDDDGTVYENFKNVPMGLYGNVLFFTFRDYLGTGDIVDISIIQMGDRIYIRS